MKEKNLHNIYKPNMFDEKVKKLMEEKTKNLNENIKMKKLQLENKVKQFNKTNGINKIHAHNAYVFASLKSNDEKYNKRDLIII